MSTSGSAEGTALVERVRAAGALQALPRRPRLMVQDQPAGMLRVRQLLVYHAPLWYTLGRLLRWFAAMMAFRVTSARDRMAGKASERQRGVRMREMFERMGGTAIKVGQQMAVRVDFLPFEVCDELGKLMDAVPPFPVDEARRAIAEAAETDMDEVYAEFEDEPIGSASVACVWRARLHSGQRVAVKVRRPGVERQFMADLRILGWVTRFAEQLTLVRPDFFKYLCSELRDMFMDELDFNKEANFQAMFRRYVKRDKLSWLAAPRLFMELSNERVLVTEFIDGYACQDILRAVETKDEAALARLRELDISPAKLGSYIMQLSLWARLECPFFHSDPHPGNILILPGNKIMMLDFGACGITSSKQAEHYREMSRRILQNDVSGATSIALSSLTPLPRINVAELRRRIEQTTWNYHIVIKSKDAQWWERTTAALWMGMIAATKDFQMPVNLDVLRMTRASLLYDTLACRLNHKINADNGFRSWARRAERRANRRARKRATRSEVQRTAATLSGLSSFLENAQKGLFWVSALSRDLPQEFMAASNKGAFVASALLRASLAATLMLSLAGIALVVFVWAGGAALDISQPWEAVKQAVRHPATIVVLLVTLVGVLRRVQNRLEQKEPGA